MTDDLLTALSPLTERINEAMKAVLVEDSTVLGEVSLYNFMGGGKRLRPLIFCLCHSALGGRIDDDALKLAVTFEFLHMASLLHDDIVDQADTRRGRPAAHLIFGIPETIMAADYLLAKASLLALTKKNLDVAVIMGEVIQGLSLGELWELKAKNKVELTAEEYTDIILHKTAILIEGVSRAAAAVNRAGDRETDALRSYGRFTGLAFQIVDDILDYRADPSDFGKPVGQDLEEGRVTLPFILARKDLPEPDRLRLMTLGSMVSPGPQEKAEAAALVERAGGLQKAQSHADDMAAKAVSALLSLPETPDRMSLEALARYTVSRRR
jgi:octaprenyl-diphosphate synthase